MQPPADLAQELTDVCSCGNREQPVAVNGHSDSPTAAYKCSTDGTIWFSDWRRSFEKVVSEAVKPIGTSQQPKCQQCASPLGEPHSPSCPYGQYPTPPTQVGQVGG